MNLEILNTKHHFVYIFFLHFFLLLSFFLLVIVQVLSRAYWLWWCLSHPLTHKILFLHLVIFSWFCDLSYILATFFLKIFKNNMLSFDLYRVQATMRWRKAYATTETREEDINWRNRTKTLNILLLIQVCNLFLQSTYLPINRVNSIVEHLTSGRQNRPLLHEHLAMNDKRLHIQLFCESLMTFGRWRSG